MEKIGFTSILLRVPEGTTIEELNEKIIIASSQLLAENGVIEMEGIKEKSVENEMLLKADEIINILSETTKKEKKRILKIVETTLGVNDLI